MASKAAISEHPNYTIAQRRGFGHIANAIHIALGYKGEEIPVLDNHSDIQLVDEVGVLKEAKKIFEKAEKAHVERLKSRMGNADSMRGQAFQAIYRGGSRVILNQEKCKELIALCDEEGIHLGRLIKALQDGALQLPGECMLKDATTDDDPGELNHTDFFTTAQGGRSLYVEEI